MIANLNCFKGNKLEDWQLVKRFQMIHAQPRFHQDHKHPVYEDIYKLQLFKSIRYVSDFEIQCEIKDDNKIQIPLILLRYKSLEILNSSLDSMHEFKLRMIFKKVHNFSSWLEILMPLLLTTGVAFAMLRTFNFKTRQNKELYDFSAFLEFILNLFSNFANAFFMLALVVALHTLQAQQTVKSLLPTTDSEHYIELMLYFALVFKVILVNSLLYLLVCNNVICKFSRVFRWLFTCGELVRLICSLSIGSVQRVTTTRSL